MSDGAPTDSAPPTAGLTYAAAGVDIDAADAAVEAIRPLVASTTGVAGALGAIGGFGGLFELPAGYTRPVLVSSTDGVGTKLAVAMATGRFDSIGIDLVAMSVDDLVCCGARPLFFLDYQLLGRIDPDQAKAVMTGIAEGCRQAGVAIVGGEMAEHPGLIEPGELDLAGFAVGVVEHGDILDGPSRTRAGDVLIGLPSPGLRSNGYSLARRALLDVAGRDLDGPAWEGAGEWTLADELLRPSVIYSPAIVALLESEAGQSGAARGSAVHAICHVTGGGLPGNMPRVLGPEVDAVFDRSTWDVPAIFGEVQAAGGIADDEMDRVFNLGLGMVVMVAPHAAGAAIEVLNAAGHAARQVGVLEPGERRVRYLDR